MTHDDVLKKPDLQALLPAVAALARQAGAEIMAHYHTASATAKADGTIVTEADLASEKIILAGLAQLTPQIPIVSEERVAAGQIPDISGGTFWTVDPLDGTTEFKNQKDGFAVAISLIVDNKPVMSVIYYPKQDLMLLASGPGTAQRIHNGVHSKLASVNTSSTAPRALVNESHADLPRIKGYLTQQFNDKAKIVLNPGTDVTCVYQVVNNDAEMAIICSAKRGGKKYWWDAAPGQALAEAAGARFETWDGKPVVYDSNDLLVPPYIVAAPTRAPSLKPR